MLTKDQAGEMFARMKAFASADEVEVLFYSTSNALTRFANNVIHQNMAEENVVVSVRTAFGQRTARATTNRLDDESLRRVVAADHTASDRQWVALASRLAASGWLSSSSPMIRAGVGRCSGRMGRAPFSSKPFLLEKRAGSAPADTRVRLGPGGAHSFQTSRSCGGGQRDEEGSTR